MGGPKFPREPKLFIYYYYYFFFKERTARVGVRVPTIDGLTK